MDHRPIDEENVSKYNTDIHVSGHIHHGQMIPINIITNMVYKLRWGHTKINNTNFVVSCGAQGWGPQVRTGSFSEIVEINVSFSGN